MEGVFYEVSDDAKAYHMKQLGLDAIHHLLTALSIFYSIDHWVGYDNEGAVKTPGEGCIRVDQA